MSRVLSAAEICARALRAIGKFPVSEAAPDGEALREAMHWLDLIMADLAGSTTVFSRTTSTISLELTNGTQSYDLEATLGTELPIDRIQFPVEAWLEDEDGNRSDLEIVTLHKFESVSVPATTGQPCWVHIDRQAAPTARFYPTPHVDDPKTYTMKLVVQQYAPNVAPAGVTGTIPSGTVAHQFGVAWQKFLVTQLAHDLGSGPITKIGEASLTRFAAMAGDSKTRMLAFENREHETTPPICEPWGLC